MALEIPNIMARLRIVPRAAGDTTDELAGLPARLRYALEVKGVSQQTLAHASGVDAAVISRIATGKRVANVTADTIIRLALALEVPIEWLCAGKSDPVR